MKSVDMTRLINSYSSQISLASFYLVDAAYGSDVTPRRII